MSPKAMIPLIVGLCIAGLAAKLGFDYMQKARASTTKTVQVFTVTEDVPRGVAVSEAMLRPMKFPAEFAPKTALVDPKQIVGRVPHTGLTAGLPILDTGLLAEGVKAGVYVPPGLRAVAVKIDESSGVDNHLEPGCHVDVVGYFNVKSGGKNQTIARTIIENVEVAAVGARLAPDKPSASDPKADPKKKAATKEKAARAVTLLVKPDQVPTLHLAEQRGEIKLSMRNSDDESPRAKSDKTGEAQVLGQPEDESAEGEPKPGLLDAIAGWFKRKESAPTSAPVVVAPAPEPTPDPEPKFDWVMVIFNGTEQRTFGWRPDNKNHPVEIGVDGPNIFQDDPKRKSKTPASDSTDGESDPPPAEPEPQSQEPKELVG